MVVTSNYALEDGAHAGYYLPEVIDFYEVVNAAGIEVDIASPRGGMTSMYQRRSNLASPSTAALLEQTGLLADLDHSIPLAQVVPEHYDAVYFVGGFAALEDFPTDPEVARVGAGVYEQGGSVAAVCHGPAALVNIRLSSGQYLVEGRKVTSRSSQQDRPLGGLLALDVERALRNRGAEFQKRSPGSGYVVVDERLITGQGPASTTELAERLVEQLQSTATPPAP